MIKSDQFYRRKHGHLGIDEFAILLTRSGWQDGLQRAEAFDALINGATVDWHGELIANNGSYGVRTYGPEDDMSEVQKSADDAMYATKRVFAMNKPAQASA
jgi:GGDEF domain-containing protein